MLAYVRVMFLKCVFVPVEFVDEAMECLERAFAGVDQRSELCDDVSS